jgi:hypothetical protein
MREANVVQMFGVCIEGTQPIIVMEYCSGGLSLNEKERKKKKEIQTHFNYFLSLNYSN